MRVANSAEISVLEWRDKLVCSQCGGHHVDMVVTGTERRIGCDTEELADGHAEAPARGDRASLQDGARGQRLGTAQARGVDGPRRAPARTGAAAYPVLSRIKFGEPVGINLHKMSA